MLSRHRLRRLRPTRRLVVGIAAAAPSIAIAAAAATSATSVAVAASNDWRRHVREHVQLRLRQRLR